MTKYRIVRLHIDGVAQDVWYVQQRSFMTFYLWWSTVSTRHTKKHACNAYKMWTSHTSKYAYVLDPCDCPKEPT